MKKYWFIVPFLTAWIFSACEPEFSNPVDPDNPEVTSGDADFTTYVAIGNSLTAGYSNGTLYLSGQQNSFPVLLAERMKEAGGGEFTVPYMENDKENIGGLKLNGQIIVPPRLVVDAGEKAVERLHKEPTEELTVKPGPYNNMGVPAAKIYHYVYSGYGNMANLPLGKANPFFVRMASSPEATIFEDVMAQHPTFFTMWVGNNDVLWYATSGGTGTDQTGNPDPSTYGPNDLTDPTLFAYLYNQMVDALVQSGAKGILATIPDVASIPYFTTIPYNPVPLDEETATMLNQAFANYNNGLQLAYANGLITEDELNKRTVHYTAGQNPLLITDEYLTDLTSLGLPSVRQTTPDDLIVLPAAGVIGKADPVNPQLIAGVTAPLADRWVLTDNEVATVRNITAQYNATIKGLAQNYELGLVDMAAAMDQLVSGLRLEDNSIYTADYFSGFNTLPNLFFSLDGVHPNRKGYVILANKVIDAINNTYHSTLRKYNPGYFDADIMIVPSN